MLKARNLIQMSIDEVWELPDGPMKLQFDDGIIETTTRHTIFSRYIWEVHAQYPQTPILMKHHIGNTRLGTDTHMTLLSNAIWDCVEAYASRGGVDLEVLEKLAYDITNRIYNDCTIRLEAYVGSISALDFVEAMDHPAIEGAMEKLKDPNAVTPGAIESTYVTIRNTLTDPKELVNNGVAKAAKGGLVSMGQIQQCVGPRGLTTDIDSHIFRRPIIQGFGHGLMSLEDTMKESRSAAKALFFAKDPMRQSEYFNRQQQIVSAILSNLHQGDCGSTDYIPFMVKPGDIPLKPNGPCSLEGIWFYDPNLGKTRPIMKTDRHLIGKTIMIRSVFTCRHPDPYGVCTRCFGDIGLSVPRGTNVGHMSTSELLSELAQRILSTKHEDSSATVEPLILDDFEKQYLHIGGNPNEIHINDSLIGKKFKIYFPVEEAQYLPDITLLKNIKDITTERLSSIGTIHLEMPRGKDVQTVALTVATATRNSSLTTEALKYIRDHGWIITADERYCIDMSEWKKGHAFLELPMKHFSTVDYMFAIGSMLKGSGGKRGSKSLKNYETVAGALMGLHELVNSKLTVNLSHIQTTMFTMMVQSEDQRNYHLPNPKDSGDFANYKQVMSRRSLAAAMAYQHQTEIIFSLESFLIKDRPNHPLDPMLCP